MERIYGSEMFLPVLAVICVIMMIIAFYRFSLKRKAAARNLFLLSIAGLILVLSVYSYQNREKTEYTTPEELKEIIAQAGEYSGSPYTVINGNMPFFTPEEMNRKPFAEYSELDELGRCGSAIGMISRDMMPKDPRGEIDTVKPSGYHNAVYEDLIEDGFLYNRCHLLGYQLTGENANERNLITGTRYMNTEGMEPYENMAASYVRMYRKPVLIRVTPVFLNDELVCRGVLMEAWSPEDSGKGICFCVYCHNVQPGIEIDYLTGRSKRK